MNTFFTVSRELLEQGRSVRFKASGWSMRPLIKNGDFITACPVKDRSMKRGDIVFYSAGNSRVLVHRIIGLRRNSGEMIALIQGDACSGPPDKIPVQNILGRVVTIERDRQERRLDTWPYGLIGLLFAVISPFTRWAYSVGSKVKYGRHRSLGFRRFMENFLGSNN